MNCSKLFVLLFVISISMVCASNTPTNTNMTLHLFDKDKYPEAVCNDGTQAGFYFREGTQPQRWVIYLEGGGLCYDKASCAARSQKLTSSSSRPSNLNMAQGLFNKDCSTNDYWCVARAVYVFYCTSDFYSGDREASAETYNFHFRGSKVIDAVFDVLLKNYGLKDHYDSKEILFTGCSAGAKGVAYNMDKVQPKLPNAKALIDSDWWLDNDPMDKRTVSLKERARMGYSLFNSQMNPKCVLENKDQPWLCLFPYKNEAFYQMPHLTQEFQYDAYQLDIDTNNTIMQHKKAAVAYAEEFRNYMKNTFEEMNPKNSALFAPACYRHCSITSNHMFEISIKGTTLATYLLEWFFGYLNTPKLIDDCEGLNCSGNCPWIPYQRLLKFNKKLAYE